MRPLFTIIMPTFNCAAKIDASAQSVLSQQAGLYEFLVLDGKSTDGTVEKLRQYGNQIRWVSEPDAGIYDAMNKGIKNAHGRFLYFLGAGDVLRPGVLATLAGVIERADTQAKTGLGFYYGDVRWGNSQRRYDGYFSRFKLSRANICHQAIFYDADIFARLGVYNLRYRYCADYVFNLQCFADTHIRRQYVDLVIADYEAVGWSAQNPDVDFEADFSKLILKYCGWPCLAGVKVWHGIQWGHGRLLAVRWHLRRIFHKK